MSDRTSRFESVNLGGLPVSGRDIFLAEQHHAHALNAHAHTAGWGNALLDGWEPRSLSVFES